MKISLTKEFSKAIYDKETCHKIKYRAEDPSGSDTFYAIWGDDVPSDIELVGKCKCNACTAYVFYKLPSGLYQPVRATYSAKTLANFAKAERKFGHLRPESEF